MAEIGPDNPSHAATGRDTEGQMENLKVGQKVMIAGSPAVVLRVRKFMQPIPDGYVPVRNVDSQNGVLVHRDMIDAA